jgi:hypothetical protein
MDENESNWLGNLTLDDMFVKDVENQTRQHPLYIGQQR